ncbi:damage-inducible protein DinB [Pedobacter lusitanus]|uniref:Damage-inducible protein DinB n=2 Tax=Pedobacter lusitanus TaxID=1503925 RepID=A0A0D0GKE9_9SPHI|nr:damage-inducible protein DinB [Pedobacter lusitanus]
MLQDTNVITNGIITQDALLNHWQGHRRVTRRLIEAFPEDQLFNYSIGGMRPFADMVKEILGLSGIGIRGIVTGNWTPTAELDYRAGNSAAKTKAELLLLWDQVTAELNALWLQIPHERFHEVVKAFGEYEGYSTDIILYWIDNEIHHRAQGYVYLRALGIEPPAFWNRD